jgi:hypothetical protein
MRIPQLRLLEPVPGETLKVVGDRWRASRVDASEATAITHRTNMGRVLRVLGDRRVDAIAVADVTKLVGDLNDAGAARESPQDALDAGEMLDFAGVTPNPARDKRVKLPADDRPRRTLRTRARARTPSSIRALEPDVRDGGPPPRTTVASWGLFPARGQLQAQFRRARRRARCTP